MKKEKVKTFISDTLFNYQKELIERIEKYFNGLIVIPYPKETKKKIINLIKDDTQTTKGH